MKMKINGEVAIINSIEIGTYLIEHQFITEHFIHSGDVLVCMVTDLIKATTQDPILDTINASFINRLDNSVSAVETMVTWWNKITAELDYVIKTLSDAGWV